MTDPTLQVLARFGNALGRSEPERALREALAVARELGVVLAEEGTGRPWTTLRARQRNLSLALLPDAALGEDTLTLIAGGLQAALSRAALHAERDRIAERMELLSSASFEGLFFHVDGVVFDVNQRVVEMSGYDREELIDGQAMNRCVSPEDLAVVRDHIAKGSEDEYVITAIRKDGRRFRAEMQAKQGKLGDRPVRVVAVRDVTERERTQALLRESEQRLQNLAEHTFDLTVFSRDGIIVDVVGRLRAVLGYDEKQVIGHRILEFVGAPAQPHIARAIGEQRIGVFETLARAATGEEIPMEVVAVRATLNGEPVRMSAMRDLRPARRLEQQRLELERAFERSQRLDSLGVLAGGIAHDFNNLLTVVIGNAHLMLARANDADSRELTQAIIDAAKRAASLTAQMLAYAGRADLGPRVPIDLGALITELRTLLDATLSKKAHISLEIAPKSVVLGNRATLTQLLLNLLTNASDALLDQPGTIEVRTRHVEQPDERWASALGTKVTPGRWLLLEVSDSGVGMDEATQARIFEPFFTTKARGHGLGLAASIGIVSSHGGAIRVESEKGRGSTFFVLLPAHEGEPLAPPEPPGLERRASARVLVVDDEPLVRSHLRRLLEDHGYEVEEAQSGRAALVALGRSEPSAILLDMTMPDLSGIEVLRAIRERGSRVPVILSSGYHDAAFELVPDTFQGFLLKPYLPAELLEALRRVLATRQVRP